MMSLNMVTVYARLLKTNAKVRKKEQITNDLLLFFTTKLFDIQLSMFNVQWSTFSVFIVRYIFGLPLIFRCRALSGMTYYDDAERHDVFRQFHSL